MKRYTGLEQRTAEAHYELHVLRKIGRVVIIDGPQEADKPDTFLGLIVSVKGGGLVRVPLTRHEAVNMARALMAQLA